MPVARARRQRLGRVFGDPRLPRTGGRGERALAKARRAAWEGHYGGEGRSPAVWCCSAPLPGVTECASRCGELCCDTLVTVSLPKLPMASGSCLVLPTKTASFRGAGTPATSPSVLVIAESNIYPSPATRPPLNTRIPPSRHLDPRALHFPSFSPPRSPQPFHTCLGTASRRRPPQLDDCRIYCVLDLRRLNSRPLCRPRGPT